MMFILGIKDEGLYLASVNQTKRAYDDQRDAGITMKLVITSVDDLIIHVIDRQAGRVVNSGDRIWRRSDQNAIYLPR